jgi:hypothetical protein
MIDLKAAAASPSVATSDSPKGADVPAAAPDTHDFRDRGNAMEKVYPITDWRSWERRNEMRGNDNEWRQHGLPELQSSRRVVPL